MSELRVETLTMPAASLGPKNPLPPLRSERDMHAVPVTSPEIPERTRRQIGYGRVDSIFPYRMQDRYDRQREPRAFEVAILENDQLKATFLLSRGGRLWSLVHKPSDRELLYVNPVFQPANLALRNAWFSGGVEWNIGTIGHSPFTCAPLFAARVDGPEGTPVLRMYEWERIRRVPFQIDAFLPDGSPVLYVCIRIINPHDDTIPMYWWSNIAVPETSKTRVIAPADSAYAFGYGGQGLNVHDLPEIAERDVTYPANLTRAADFFFRIPDGTRPWITALDGQGEGLVQVSTSRLQGRKLFVWGMGEGGRTWQSFLSKPGEAYIEIQAGLARTQLEHLPMEAHASWTWLEAYGPLAANADAVRSPDWREAREAAAEPIAQLVPRGSLVEVLARYRPALDRPVAQILQRGSGWGALEARRREVAGEPPLASEALIFDADSLTAAQRPWLQLLETGSLPSGSPEDGPEGYVMGADWYDRLANAVKAEETWLGWLHIGLMRYHQGDTAGARAAWQRSREIQDNPWAMRNLAWIAWEESLDDKAAALYVAAVKAAPACAPLVIECGRKLLAMDRSRAWLSLTAELPDDVRTLGRVRLLEGQAALAVGALDRVASLFDGSLVVEDLREGERSLSDLWFEYQTRRVSREESIPINEALRKRVRESYPVPDSLDFRMS